MSPSLLATLYEVLGRRLGQSLTPEVASEMVREVAGQFYPGPINTDGIEPRVVGSFVLECQRLSAVFQDLKRIHREHWDETEEHRHGLEFNPDYARAMDLELQGRYLLIVARRRETGEIVGNYGLYLSRSMHTQTLMATEDTLFLTKGCRRGRLGIELIRYGEEALRAVGVKELNVSVKLVNTVGQMIERMGYAPVATQYTKVLQEVADVLP